jgi:hypothetical protein
MIAIGAFLFGIVLGLRATAVLVALVLVAGLFGTLAIGMLGVGNGGPSLLTMIFVWGALQAGYLVGLFVRRFATLHTLRRGSENQQKRVSAWRARARSRSAAETRG